MKSSLERAKRVHQLLGPSLTVAVALVLLTVVLYGLGGLPSVHADPGTVYVDGATGSDTGTGQDPGSPCRTIGYAISQAANGDTILITAGTYTENLTIGNGVSLTLRGGYAVSGSVWSPGGAETVVDGSGTIGHPVVRVGDGDAALVMDTLTLTGGRAPGAGGINAGDATVTIRNCVIRGNTVEQGGGGGAVAGDPNTRFMIVDSRIVGNQVDSTAGPGNTGGAGGIRAGGPVTLVNTVVADNLGDAGIHTNGSLTLLNVTVTNNDGDIIFNPAGTAVLAITNSIVWGQFTFLAGCPAGSGCQVNYSDVQGWQGGGTGNINADPRFLGVGDYRLRTGSPCIDKGTPVGAPAADLRGTLRDALPDMGAYEWTGFRTYLPVTPRRFAP